MPTCTCIKGSPRDCYDLRHPLPVDDLARQAELQNRIQDREECGCVCHEPEDE